MAVFTETIKLDDQVSGPAKAASGAVADLGKGMSAASATLVKTGASAKPVGAALGDMSKKTFDASNAMAVGKETISAAFTGIANAAKSLAAGDVKGAVQGVTDSVASMAKLLDLAVPGLGQAAAAVIQIAGGLVGISAGLIKSGIEFAISSSEAKQQMLGLFDAMGGGIVTGEQTEAMIDALKEKTGIAKDSLVEYTKSLMAMGQTDLSQLNDSLLATASAAALVKGGDAAFLSLTKKIQTFVQTGEKLKLPLKGLGSLADVGLTVDDVAKKMGVSAENLGAALKAGTVDAGKFGDAMQDALIDKGAGPLAKFSASSANIKKLLSESFGDIFEDIDVGPFLAEIKSLFDIFSQSKASGQGMKAGIGGFFKEALSLLTKVVPMAKHFLLDMIIYGLKAYIALKPIVKTIKEFVESATGASIISTILTSVWEVLKVIGISVLVVVAAALVLWGAMILVSTAVWTAVGAVLGFVGEAGTALTGWVATAATAAYDFVAGLVNGIANGASQVIGAVTGLAGKATGAFKSALGIASPSKVMAGMGGHMTDGVAEGLDDGAADVQAATTGVAGAAVKGMSSGGSSSGGKGGGGGAQITVQVLIDGAGKSALEITEEMVAQVFSRMALEAGV